MTFLERQIENPVRFARIKRWFYVVLVALALAEIAGPMVFHGGHAYFSFEQFPAWGSLYGFGSCVAIIVVSKLIGMVWLMRREDYYDC